MLAKQLRILIIEDTHSDILLIKREIRKSGYDVEYEHVETLTDLENALNLKDWDIILSDYSLPNLEAPQVLELVREQKKLDTPLIIVSGTISEDVAVNMMKSGANDYFNKDKLQRLVPAIERELQKVEQRRKGQEAQDRFFKIFLSSPVGITIVRYADGTMVDVNPHFSEILGYTREEMLGKSGEDLNLWVNRKQRSQYKQFMYRHGAIRSTEVTLQKASGEEIYVLLSADLIELEGETCILTFAQDISQQKQQQNEILATKNLLEKTFASLNEAVFVADPKTKIFQMCNAAVEDIFGYRPEELIGQSAELVLESPELLDNLHKIGKPILETGNILQIEYPMRHKSGKTIYTDLTVTSLNEERGFEDGVVCVIRDITAKKIAEKRIEQSNKIIQLLGDVAVASNASKNIKDILQYTIEAICLHTGWNIGHAYLIPDSDQNKEFSESVWYHSRDKDYPAFREYTENIFKRANKGLVSKAVETKQAQWMEDLSQNENFLRAEVAKECGFKGGYIFPVLMNDEVAAVFEFFSEHSTSEADIDMLGVMAQIGTQVAYVIEREQAKANLHESEARYRSLFDLSRNPVYIQDLDGNFIDANPAALSLLGYDQQDISSLSLHSIVIPEQINHAVTIFRQTLMYGYQRDLAEFSLQCKDGTVIDVESVASVIYRDGEPWAVQGIVHDITARKEAHAAEQVRRIFAEVLHHTVSKLFDGDLDLGEMFDLILGYALDLIPCDSATLMLVDADLAQIVQCKGYEQEDMRAILNTKLIINKIPTLDKMAHSKQSVIVNNTENYPDWRTNTLPSSNIMAYLGAPIFIGERLCGFINLENRLANQFSSEHAAQLEMLTDQTAIAIHNARLYQEIKQSAKRLEALHDIDRHILAAEHPETIAQIVLQQLKSMITFDGASIMVLDDRFEYATFLAIEAEAENLWKVGDRILTENHPALRLMDQNKLYIIHDASQISDFAISIEQQVVDTSIGSYAAFPLISSGSLFGVLAIWSKQTNSFSSDSIDIMQEVAAQLAIAIEKSNLLEIERQRNTEFVVLRMASLQLTANLDDMQLVLNTILDYAIFLIQADKAYISLYDGEKLHFGAAFWDGELQTSHPTQLHSEGFTYTVARTGQQLAIPDLRQHHLFENQDLDGALLGFPLIIAEKIYGVMSIAFEKSRHFSDQEIRVLELLADQATIAIHNVQLYQQIQGYADELEERVNERTFELQRQTDLMETILSNSSDAILLLTADGNIIQANRAFCSLYECENMAIKGQSFSDIAGIQQSALLQEALQNVIDKQIYQRIELIASVANGETAEVDVILSPVETNGEIQSKIVCSLRDITVQKQIETELRNALMREQELNKLKSNFTSIVSHEFRTPLAVISSSAEILMTYYDRLNEEKRHTYLARIREKVKSLTRLMEDVLILSRSETVGFKFEPKPTDLIEFCEAIITEVNIGYGQEGIINFSHSGIINQQIAIDPELISHILHNLLSNAVKYSPDDGAVELDVICSKQALNIRIQDHGIGIPQKYKEKLFQPFQRATNVGNIQGTGIGLTIIKRAVDAHQGTIECTSTEGEGTTFTISIPLLAERDS